MTRRIRVNAALYQVALIIGAANSEAADFAHARVVAFENPPLHKPKRPHRGLTLTQTPGRLDVPPEQRSAGTADGAQDFPPLRSVGPLPNEEN